ncbi:MATE family efflux transporter [Anaerolentibacter hominis]|uniref:MATE family efflux transporter n=1 Tax=Anaerolentibacter hominis TaxID=3079009 RepID=UPI0031B89F2F
MNENPLAKEFNVRSLLRFAAPTIFMMIFMGLYTIVDIIFVARYVNTDALAAINIVCPVINLTVGLAGMLGAGGSAVISRKMGSGRTLEAKQNFTLLLLAGLIIGMILAAGGLLFIKPLLDALGASGILFPYCKDYLTILLLLLPANILQCLFQNLFVTTGKPGFGLILSLLAGTANILFDYLFIVVLHMGISGAALGTGIGYLIPTAAGIVFFWKGKGTLSIVKPRWDFRMLSESCLNGSSELVGQLASAITAFLFNITMIKWLGEDGVASITIMIYSQFLLSTLFFGFGIGVAPVIGFNYGSGNHARLKIIFRISLGFIIVVSLAVFFTAFFGAPAIAAMFAKKNSQVYRITAEGFSIFAFSFLFCGLNIFTSAMFTALSNGRVSAVLSFLRTLGFVTMGILFLPRLLGVTGIWLAVPLAELIMVFLSAGCLLRYRKRYGY